MTAQGVFAISRVPFEVRLARHVEFTMSCWLWTGATKAEGYGNVWNGGGYTQAHRWVWLNLVGPIPLGKELDHLCRVRNCVNPDHLDVVTPKVNAERTPRARATCCKNGHDRTDPANVYVRKNGTKACRPCHARRVRERRAASRSNQ